MDDCCETCCAECCAACCVLCTTSLQSWCDLRTPGGGGCCTCQRGCCGSCCDKSFNEDSTFDREGKAREHQVDQQPTVSRSMDVPLVVVHTAPEPPLVPEDGCDIRPGGVGVAGVKGEK